MNLCALNKGPSFILKEHHQGSYSVTGNWASTSKELPSIVNGINGAHSGTGEVLLKQHLWRTEGKRWSWSSLCGRWEEKTPAKSGEIPGFPFPSFPGLISLLQNKKSSCSSHRCSATFSGLWCIIIQNTFLYNTVVLVFETNLIGVLTHHRFLASGQSKAWASIQ